MISEAGIFLIYISTDYVFDGRNPPYGENDAPNPLNVYGKSKLEGEREVLRHSPGASTLYSFLYYRCHYGCHCVFVFVLYSHAWLGTLIPQMLICHSNSSPVQVRLCCECPYCTERWSGWMRALWRCCGTRFRRGQRAAVWSTVSSAYPPTSTMWLESADRWLSGGSRWAQTDWLIEQP